MCYRVEMACVLEAFWLGRRTNRNLQSRGAKQNLRQQTRKARRVPPVKKEGPGEGLVKQEEPFEGKCGQRATSIGRGAIPAMRAGTPDRARPTQAPPPDRSGSGPRQDHPRPLHHVRSAGKQVQPRLQQSTCGQRTVNARSTHSQRRKNHT